MFVHEKKIIFWTSFVKERRKEFGKNMISFSYRNKT